MQINANLVSYNSNFSSGQENFWQWRLSGLGGHFQRFNTIDWMELQECEKVFGEWGIKCTASKSSRDRTGSV